MYSIGEFSKITGLTVKTLRFYHEQGLLAPSYVDDQTGYRYYAANKVEAARVIAQLRQFDFNLAEIGEILRSCADEADLLDRLERHKLTLRDAIKRSRAIVAALDQIIAAEQGAQAAMHVSAFQVLEKTADPMLIAGIRLTGKYSDCGQAFAQLGRRFGQQICGQPFLLHYDAEYKEDDADFEACMPIRKGIAAEGVSVRELTGGRCLTLLHQGPYDQLGRSYARILSEIKKRGDEIEMPTREIYLKGPGMIFRGNPQKYLTEIQMFISGQSNAPASSAPTQGLGSRPK